MSFSEKSKVYERQNNSLSKEGYRVIAVCDGPVKSMEEKDLKNLSYIGLVGFIDPVREEVKNREWFNSVDCSYKIANIINHLNYGNSIDNLINDKEETAVKVKRLRKDW